ncbi:glycosyltransferase [Pseudoalteromonas sp. NEC-BIFX-2020_015]|uniref:glycosyltransferase n=1 Tax=Pseudoalteromonas sp. NEC-BIFX-2020_015 TaxID=2729544 RepID=UPI001461455F|nr:glycosyltransferase [Pseudoalteromonas sp. NEC-BIFX-2020_015]NMR24171.1 glycosyltransferase [Pseudoalteromonas sp. NEC-BIFX-2020_015]
MKFVVFGEDWGRHPSSTQHLFKELSEKHEVHWINSIGMRKPSIKVADIKRVLQKFMQLFSSNTNKKNQATSADNDKLMKVYNLFILPWHDFNLARMFNRYLFSRCSFLNEQPIIYWLSVPTAISLISPRKGIDRVVYYCGDDFSALAGVDHQMVEPFESALIKKADLIYVISDFLADKMPKEKVELLTHGVDFDLFHNRAVKAIELKGINKPKIGFYGSLNAWLDKALLYKLATSRTQYELVLVGNISDDFSDLLALSNVTHINAVDHARLAQFSQHWQVSLLPFIDNEQIRACDPLKLKEYLACGTPIVATSFPAVNKYQETILVAHDHDGFITRVDIAVQLSCATEFSFSEIQSNLASNHSWQSKASLVESHLVNLSD